MKKEEEKLNLNVEFIFKYLQKKTRNLSSQSSRCKIRSIMFSILTENHGTFIASQRLMFVFVTEAPAPVS